VRGLVEHGAEPVGDKTGQWLVRETTAAPVPVAGSTTQEEATPSASERALQREDLLAPRWPRRKPAGSSNRTVLDREIALFPCFLLKNKWDSCEPCYR